MVDTDQHRICWMYHDILSHPLHRLDVRQICRKRDTHSRSMGQSMAWVAAGHQEDSFIFV